MNNKLNQVQEIELEILQKFHSICEKHNLVYFLDAGTLLGAVRHKGFIPWDDDIDVGMPRNDYEKFLKIAQNELGDKYFLQNRKTDKNYPFNFSKIRKNNTSFVEWGLRNVKMHHGIYIDIFPYDILPIENQEEYMRECLYLDKQFLRKFVPDLMREKEPGMKGFLKNLYKKTIYFLYKFIPEKMLDKKAKQLFTKYNNLDYKDKIYACHSFRDFYKFEGNIIFPISKVNFEGYKFNAPHDTDKFLRKFYDDYMQLPPKDQRQGHSPYLIDVNKEYNVY